MGDTPSAISAPVRSTKPVSEALLNDKVPDPPSFHSSNKSPLKTQVIPNTANSGAPKT